MDILDDLKSLHEQATKERSHYYVARTALRAIEEIELLKKQCKGLALAALNNGQGLLLYESALKRIKDLSDSEDGEPLDDAIRIAEQALAFEAPQLDLDGPR